MATLTDVIDNLCATVQECTGMPTYGYVMLSPPAPCALVYPEGGDYSATYRRGIDVWRLRVQLLLPLNSDEDAQRQLYDYLSGDGDRSVVRAVYRRPTLGTSTTEAVADTATTMTAHATGVSEYGTVQTFEGIPLLQAVVSVEVHAKGSE